MARSPKGGVILLRAKFGGTTGLGYTSNPHQTTDTAMPQPRHGQEVGTPWTSPAMARDKKRCSGGAGRGGGGKRKGKAQAIGHYHPTGGAGAHDANPQRAANYTVRSNIEPVQTFLHANGQSAPQPAAIATAAETPGTTHRAWPRSPFSLPGAARCPAGMCQG